MKDEAMIERKTAYSNLLESVGVGLEAIDSGEYMYVMGYDGNLWYTNGGSPMKISANRFEELLNCEKTYIIDARELYEFEEVLPNVG